jgi:hypothetical protein
VAILVFTDVDEGGNVERVGWEVVWMRGYNVTCACTVLQMQVYFPSGAGGWSCGVGRRERVPYEDYGT